MFFVFTLLLLLSGYLLLTKSEKAFPIIYLFLFGYFLQYIYANYLIYNYYPVLTKWMPLKQDQYFAYAIPAFGSMVLGLMIFNKDFDLRDLLAKINPKSAATLGYFLVAISYVTDLIFPLIPGLSSIVTFTGSLKYVGAISLLFSNSPLNYALIVLINIQSLYTALRIGVFMDFFIWSTFLFFFVSLKFRFSVMFRLSFFIIGGTVLFLVQSVKDEYRAATWGGSRTAGLETFSDLTTQVNAKNANKAFVESPGVVKTIARLSQGWHLGKVMKWVPRRQPFVNGEEMAGDLFGSIIPRILFTDKKFVGTQDKFFEYTGYRLQTSTSMTIGVIGDFYVNFGKQGSIALLFVYGALVSFFLRFFMTRYVATDPLNIIWIPFMFSYFIRANNDFYMVFNCFLKGFLIFLFLRFVWRQAWAIKPPKRIAVE